MNSVPHTTADLLADIGAIDANLLSLPLDELERIQFYVEERDKLLRLLQVLVESESGRQAPEVEELRLVSAKTQEIRSKIQRTRDKILGEMEAADKQLHQLNSLRTPLEIPSHKRGQQGSLLNRIG